MIGRMKQWHPVFAQLLRPAVEGYYEVQTSVPVGDAPREADFILLRRTSRGAPPFRGLWRHLTSWNILEFKGPTVSPRRGDIELLVELGLGIDRRLRAARADANQPLPLPDEVSFWYLANRLGRRFVREVETKLGSLEPLGAGLWCSRLLGRLVFWVSSIDVPVEEDSLPLPRAAGNGTTSSPVRCRKTGVANTLRRLAGQFAPRSVEGD